MLNEKQTPDVLFKYRPLDNNGWKMLEGGEIFFASPRRFNDPFDCKIPPKLDAIPAKLLEDMLERSVKRHYPNASREERRAKIKEKRKNYKRDRKNKPLMEEIQNLILADLEATFGVFSLSSTDSNILMWSHYADKHTGFCIGFKTDDLLQEVKKQCPRKGVAPGFFKLSYQDKYPSMKLRPNQRLIDVLNRMVSVKSNEWSYEKEYRIVLIGKTNEKMTIPKSIITRLVLGANIDDESRKKIGEIVEENYPHIELLQAKKGRNRFELTFQSLNTPHEGAKK